MNGVEVVRSLAVAAHVVHDDVRRADLAEAVRVVCRVSDEWRGVSNEERWHGGITNRLAVVPAQHGGHAEPEDVPSAADRVETGTHEWSDVERTTMQDIDRRVVDRLQCDENGVSSLGLLTMERGDELNAGIHGTAVCSEGVLAACLHLELAHLAEAAEMRCTGVDQEVDRDEGKAIGDGVIGDFQGGLQWRVPSAVANVELITGTENSTPRGDFRP